jgi:CyaY protein
MTESEFNTLSEITLAGICRSVDGCGLDCDVEMKGDGVLEIILDNGSRLIINRQIAMHELWVAAKSGGYHFRHDGRLWLDTRDGSELFSSLSRHLTTQSGEAVVLKP